MGFRDEDYWNHNVAYHQEIVEFVARRGGRCLDVGCGDGLLAAKLASRTESVLGIDRDPNAVSVSRDRTRRFSNVEIREGDFSEMGLPSSTFDVVVFVASIHHGDVRTSLSKARRVLKPSGGVFVLGLTRDETIFDLLFSAVCVPLAWLGSRLHEEQRDRGGRTAESNDSLSEIRELADAIFAGAVVRRRLYFRYSLVWSQQ